MLVYLVDRLMDLRLEPGSALVLHAACLVALYVAFCGVLAAPSRAGKASLGLTGFLLIEELVIAAALWAPGALGWMMSQGTPLELLGAGVMAAAVVGISLQQVSRRRRRSKAEAALALFNPGDRVGRVPDAPKARPGRR